LPPGLPPSSPPFQTPHRHFNPRIPNLQALSSENPSASAAASLLAAAARAGDLRLGRALHRRLLGTEILDTDALVANSLLTMYSKCGHVSAARRVFDGMRGLRDLVSWTAMAFCLARNGAEQEALLLLGEMLESGLRPNAFTLCAAARACFPGELFRLSGGAVLGFVLKTGFWGTDVSVGCALIDMFARNGDLVAARKVFDGLVERTVVVWTLMITRHVGLVKEGKEYFRSMQKDHGLVPRMEHYSCMVDLLARSGLVQEALDFINEMPCKADALIWKTLLGACRTYDNIEIGKIAANHVIDLEPRDPAPYVLLSNLYAHGGLWDEVARIRSLMRHKNLSKETGLSWMHVGNTIHEFRAGDTGHPQAQEIYAKLSALIREIKDIGYVPDTSIVLHDMSDELKEECLLQHSEKIAVAFGLITTSPTKPIRIFKNLRVCADCHSAIKYISKSTGREVILRDSNRFHRMKDGKCSCREYW
uniref:DYW domain-containing protein n=1 Tax=Aegilops tauschii subsp. strangulata TaxID=200361 RepID=A0A453LAI8_AEGTS